MNEQIERSGVVFRTSVDGLVYIQEDASGRPYVFTFDKILEYRGQSAQELGLHRGTRVTFDLSEGRIRCVSLPTVPQHGDASARRYSVGQ
jgi:hypothetical protein